jgi:hypothetical protein
VVSWRSSVYTPHLCLIHISPVAPWTIKSILELNTSGITSNAATILLDGANSRLVQSNGTDALTNLAANETSGSLTIQNGRSFSSAGAFSSAGSLTIGAGSTLTINGNYTQFASGSLTTEIGGSPSSGSSVKW